MEKLKKEKAVVRDVFSKLYNKIEDSLQGSSDEERNIELKANFRMLEPSVWDADELLNPWVSNVCDQLKQQVDTVVTRSALDIWQDECWLGSVVTFCKDLDDSMGGGVPLQSVTELCGAPGSGKTQLCLQLCIDVQIPRSCGGVEGSAIYIDTKSGFTPARLKDMAVSWALHCRAVYSRQVDVDEMLRGVSYLAAHDVTQLLAALHLAHAHLRAQSRVKLVVVDSLTFPFLHSAAKSLDKTRVLSVAMDKLHVMARVHKVAVVVTNQLSTRVSPGSESRLVPAHGESFAHRVNQRLVLGRLAAGRHAALLVKSPAQPCMSATFQITSAGVRDCEPPS